MFIKRFTVCLTVLTLLISLTIPALAADNTGFFERVYVKYINAASEVVNVPIGMNGEQLVKEYESRTNVEYAEIDSVVAQTGNPNDTYFSTYQTNVFNAMNITQSWDITTGSNSIIVAVLDNGIDTTHSDLEGTFLANGYDFVNDDDEPNDETGHGTMVSGIISAISNNSKGIAGATNCSILPIKVLNAQGKGYASVLAEGIIYAVDNGANVINLSCGTNSYSQTLENAVNYAYSNGVVVIAATGNTAGAIDYPAAFTSTIAVGAVNEDKSLTAYSCFGSQIDLVAVGTSVASTTLNNKYALGTGTSYSAPFVSSLAAMMLTVNPNMTVDQIESAMKSNSVDIGDTGWDQYTGEGCIDFYETLNSIGDDEPPVNDDEPPVNDDEPPVNDDEPPVNDDEPPVNDDEPPVNDDEPPVNDDEPPVNDDEPPVDNNAPVIYLNGNQAFEIARGSSYTEYGATAFDETDGDITSRIQINGGINTNVPGTYTLTYTVMDNAGNVGQISRFVTVIESVNNRPVVTLNGSQTVTIAVGNQFIDEGATAFDSEDGDVTHRIVKSGTVNTNRAGTYRITYLVKDSQNLTSYPVVRTVTVRSNAKPIIVINGSSSVSLKNKAVYTELGATARDAEDGDLTSRLIINGTVDTSKAGVYTITYTVTDNDGATTNAKRTVRVAGDSKPVIIVKGNRTINLNLGAVYTEYGVVATDMEDGDLTSMVTTTGTINTSKSGTYQIIYAVTDSSGNTTTTNRIVVIKANAKPTLVLKGSSRITLKVGNSYTEYGAKAVDKEDGDITYNIAINGEVNTTRAGTYRVVYSVTDSYGATTTVTRTITVK